MDIGDFIHRWGIPFQKQPMEKNGEAMRASFLLARV